ncbi:MAG: T9SS type A sorting domain-containing protein [Bacteroidales bacterium]|nr:T9SS type A sorting domain-containing protein [Bacteroidales bacterium]
MKKLLVSMVCLIAIVTAYAQDSYYWYKGEKIQLKEVKTEYFICYTDKNLFDYLKKSDDVIQNTSGMSFPNMNLQAGVESKLQEYFYSIVPATKLDEISQNYEIPYITKNYKLDGSEEDFCVSNIFYVKLKSEDDFSVLQNMAEQYDVTIVGNNEFNPLWYSLICFNTKNGDALHLANLFFESGAFAASEPDLMGGLPTAVISVEQEKEVSLRMTNNSSLNLQANLSNLHSVISINVYNIQGVQVKGMTLCNTNSFNEEIELCGEPIGLYVVVVQADGKIIFSKKVLICK